MKPQTNDRIRKIVARLRSASIDINNEAHKGSREQDFAFALMMEVAKIDKSLNEAAIDEHKLREIEHDSLRPIAVELRRYFLRHHLMLVQPIWDWGASVQKETGAANTVVFVGRSTTERLVRDVCARRNIKVSGQSVGFGGGQRRWNDLREANVGVFDLGGSDDRLRASVSYALGTGLVLGIFPLVIRDDEKPLPFDIDVKPVSLENSPERLESALDDAMYAAHTTDGQTSVVATLHYLLDKILENDVSVREVRQRLENDKHIDPIDGRNIAEQLLALQQRRDVGLVTPIWPALYPNMKQRKCFHVMPFSLSWSNEIRDCVRSACETNNIQYVRGDETEEQRIILSIRHFRPNA